MSELGNELNGWPNKYCLVDQLPKLQRCEHYGCFYWTNAERTTKPCIYNIHRSWIEPISRCINYSRQMLQPKHTTPNH